MNLPPQAQLSDAKYQEVLKLLESLGVSLDDIEETFVRGSGSGGQKINKTSSAVHLKHHPTGIEVKCQKFRDRPMNRIIALRDLLEKLNPNSKKAREAEKIRRQKARRRRRSASAD